jgi:hypothetical protein
VVGVSFGDFADKATWDVHFENPGPDDAAAAAAWIAAFDPAEPRLITPETISDRQFFQGLAIRGLINEDEAIAAVSSGSIPSAMLAFIAALPAEQQFSARMLLAGAVEFQRSHPLTEAFGAMQGLSSDQLDELWRYCSGL